MKRRLFIILLALAGCSDPFQYSPYQTDVPEDERDLLQKNLTRIQGQSQPAFAPFKFAVISDTHTWYDETADAVGVINTRDDLDFTVVNGDLTDNGRLREFLWTTEILSRLRIPSLTVVGAHEGITNAPEIYQKMFGPLNYSFVYNDVKFIMANTNSWEFPNRAPDFDWIERELSDAYLYTRVVFVSHVGPFDKQFDMQTRARYEQLLNDYNVTLSIHGHEHEPRDLGVPAGGGVHFLVVGGISNRIFAVIDVQADHVEVEQVLY